MNLSLSGNWQSAIGNRQSDGSWVAPTPNLARIGTMNRPGVWRLSASLLDDGGAVEPCLWHGLFLSSRPDDFECVKALGLAQADSHGEFGLRQITARRHYLAGESLGSDPDLDPRADGVAIGLSPDELQPQPMMAEGLVVAQQQGRTVDLGQHHVEITVPVDIGEGRSAADDGLEEIGAGFFRRHDRETRPVVPEQLGGLSIFLARL